MEMEMEVDRRSRRWRGSYRAKKRKKPWSERLADWTRSLVAFLFSNVGIICLVVGYTIAGAFIFIAIEDKESQRRTGNVVGLRNGTASRLWELTSKENVFSEIDWKTEVLAVLKSYQDDIVVAVRNGYDGVDTPDGSKQWSFAGAFLYSLTVITTIGYGNICPRTEWGKAVTIVYAIIGMPLFLLYLSNIGDILARSFKWTYARCCLCRCRRKPRRLAPAPSTREAIGRNLQWQMVTMHGGELETSSLEQDENSPGENGEDDDDDDCDCDCDRDCDRDRDYNDRDDRDDEHDHKYNNDNDNDDDDDDDDDDSEDAYDPQSVTVPLSLCLAIMVGYVCGGAVLFSEWEDWDFLDGSYFCFISLSTIGFGDIVPGDKIYSGQGFELSFVFCSMYLMLGMALIAMCFNLMQEEVMAKMRSLGRTTRRIFRCDR